MCLLSSLFLDCSIWWPTVPRPGVLYFTALVFSAESTERYKNADNRTPDLEVPITHLFNVIFSKGECLNSTSCKERHAFSWLLYVYSHSVVVVLFPFCPHVMFKTLEAHRMRSDFMLHCS